MLKRTKALDIFPTEKYTGQYARLLIVAGLVIALDQISKAVILHYMPLYHSIPVIEGLFSLTHVHNTGGAFGFMADGSPVLRKILFLVVACLAAGLVLYFYHKTPKKYPYLGLAFCLIFGGAIGNIIDRLRLSGGVVDFLDFYLGKWHWPTFNVADSAITVGVAIFAIHVFLNKLPE